MNPTTNAVENKRLGDILSRIAGGLSQARVSRRIGVSQALWSGWTLGNKSISRLHLIELSRHAGLDDRNYLLTLAWFAIAERWSLISPEDRRLLEIGRVIEKRREQATALKRLRSEGGL